MVKVIIHQENTTFINIDVLNSKAPKYVKKILTSEERSKHCMLIVRDFDTTFDNEWIMTKPFNILSIEECTST